MTLVHQAISHIQRKGVRRTFGRSLARFYTLREAARAMKTLKRCTLSSMQYGQLGRTIFAHLDPDGFLNASVDNPTMMGSIFPPISSNRSVCSRSTVC
jgi:hypothetical protein